MHRGTLHAAHTCTYTLARVHRYTLHAVHTHTHTVLLHTHIQPEIQAYKSSDTYYRSKQDLANCYFHQTSQSLTRPERIECCMSLCLLVYCIHCLCIPTDRQTDIWTELNFACLCLSVHVCDRQTDTCKHARRQASQPTDGQTDRQTSKQTDRIGGQTDMANRHGQTDADRRGQMQTQTLTDKHGNTDAERQMQPGRWVWTAVDRQMLTDGYRWMRKEKQAYIHTYRWTDKQTNLR